MTRLTILLSFLSILAVWPQRAADAAGRKAMAEAEALSRRAQSLIERNSIDARRRALELLEQAALLDPSNPGYDLTLARLYYQVGYLKRARARYEHVVRLTPNDAAGRFGLGQVWRRDWLKYLDPSSLARASENLTLATRIDSSFCDAWLMLVPLLVEQNDLPGAAAAAARCRVSAPRRPEPLLAVAYTSYRLGRIERADSAFAAALPNLPKNVRERFEDISPVATARDTFIIHRLSPEEQAAYVSRYWKENDPDLATRENEAQLEYWSRVAHAYFLFYNQKRREWDERGEVYVRYGPPARALYNPVNYSLIDWAGTPMNVLYWEYPDLGMKVVMQDRLLTENYMLPLTRGYDPDPTPDPEVVAQREDAVTTPGGRGVFHKLPPGVEPLPIAATVSQFEGDRLGRLLAQVESPGEPGDSLWAEWVVLDSTLKEVSRGGRSLSPSACAVTERRVGDFATELPPGSYRVGLSVRDSKGRRGVIRIDADVDPVGSSLSLSDVVVSCGAPDVSHRPDAPPAVRLEPNPGARVFDGDPLTAYFEIYHLGTGADGQSRFEYVYTVRSIEKDSRIWIKRLLSPRPQIPSISVTRPEENVGPLRRQFVSVPVQALPAGKYRLEIRVRDLIANSEAVRSAEFVKLSPETPRN